MSMKLYVGNLSYEMTEPQLQTLFSEAGEVTSAKIINDRQTGQPRGFGFVEMETKLEGQKAISMLNGRDYEGRPLTVNEAKPQAKRRIWWWRLPELKEPRRFQVSSRHPGPVIYANQEAASGPPSRLRNRTLGHFFVLPDTARLFGTVPIGCIGKANLVKSEGNPTNWTCRGERRSRS